jgi:hypothetical protein
MTLTLKPTGLAVRLRGKMIEIYPKAHRSGRRRSDMMVSAAPDYAPSEAAE